MKHLVSTQSSNTSPFDQIKHQDQESEYWSAREVQVLLEYATWQNFEETVKRAMISCQVAGQAVSDHFTDRTKMVNLGSGSKRNVKDSHLTRSACYLVNLNVFLEFLRDSRTSH